jgi:signal transduction histidine kinase/CheY-like chemotaxis protein
MVLSELSPVVSAQQAEFYVLDGGNEEPQLRLLASYASDGQDSIGKEVRLGQGLVGQCALEKEKVLLNSVPGNYIRISSGLGEAPPHTLLILPIIFEGQVKGVLELASFERFNPTHQAFLDQLTESIGIVLNTIEANMRTENLLKQSQSLAQELQSQQEELQKTNQELQEKARLLAHQNEEVENKNREVEHARRALEEKARQLALTSKYKSEFLANMSHELRTPLNSLLILSDQLCKNSERNLTARQMDFAKTIHSAGNDLLMLINDILDLSKIESGTVVVDVTELRLDELKSYVERTFRHVAEAKSVDFYTHFDPALPTSILTDAKRLQQIVKNLLSNAFKFTNRGHVALSVASVEGGWHSEIENLNRAETVLAFSVEDTGVGIPSDKQQIIFEAFQQADGSTSRKYGGTGLGLAISRELSYLLGGEIRLVSTPGRGSTFTLFLPQTYTPSRLVRKPISGQSEPVPDAAETAHPVNEAPPAKNGEQERDQLQASMAVVAAAAEPREPMSSLLLNEVGDDRDDLQPGQKKLLIVENDLAFARFLLEAAREQGFKGLVTSFGADALSLAREHNPDAITLDIYLPDIAGWRVFDRLRNDIATRHIPVCIISTDDAREEALSLGALTFVPKPIQSKDVLDSLLGGVRGLLDRKRKRLVLVEPDPERRRLLLEYLSITNVEVSAVDGGRAALDILRGSPVDCLVLPPELSDFSPADLADEMERRAAVCPVPVIVFEENPAPHQDRRVWRRLAEVCSVSRAHSLERLLDQVTYFLHLDLADLPEATRQAILDLFESNRALAGKKVLIVDDDIRNIFALSIILEEQNMVILTADTGLDAIEILQGQLDVDVVLMDIMMPEMDGFETIRVIRSIPSLKNLPIIAVTAKAMKGDREKCIEAGAWDYLSKPVDTQQMLAVLRAWLHR